MNAPQALYWYHQQPDALGYRNSSANSTGPWTSSIDPTGKPGVFNLVKYVPEETVAAAVVTEGVTEYERGLKDSTVLWRKEIAAEREKVAQLLAALEPFAKAHDSWNGGNAPLHFSTAAVPAHFAKAAYVYRQVMGAVKGSEP